MLKKCRIEVEEFGEIRCDRGLLFLEVLNAEGLDLHNDCGGQGKCGKCRVLFHSPPPEPLDGDRRHLSVSQRSAGLRLACFHQVRGDCRITIPEPARVELRDDLPD